MYIVQYAEEEDSCGSISIINGDKCLHNYIIPTRSEFRNTVMCVCSCFKFSACSPFDLFAAQCSQSALDVRKCWQIRFHQWFLTAFMGYVYIWRRNTEHEKGTEVSFWINVKLCRKNLSNKVRSRHHVVLENCSCVFAHKTFFLIGVIHIAYSFGPLLFEFIWTSHEFFMLISNISSYHCGTLCYKSIGHFSSVKKLSNSIFRCYVARQIEGR